jgi:hypothetical protein
LPLDCALEEKERAQSGRFGYYRFDRSLLMVDPAGLREAEFGGGMLIAAFPPVRRLRAYG